MVSYLTGRLLARQFWYVLVTLIQHFHGISPTATMAVFAIGLVVLYVQPGTPIDQLRVACCEKDGDRPVVG